MSHKGNRRGAREDAVGRQACAKVLKASPSDRSCVKELLNVQRRRGGDSVFQGVRQMLEWSHVIWKYGEGLLESSVEIAIQRP